jgi:hypothetical protein
MWVVCERWSEPFPVCGTVVGVGVGSGYFGGGG